jgi:hypothetical protein
LDGVVAPALGGGVEDRVRAAQAAAQVLAVVPVGHIRSAYVEDVARRLQLRPSEVMVEPTGNVSERKAAPDRERLPALSSHERMLLQLIVDQPGLACRAYQGDEAAPLFRPEVGEFVRRVADAWELEGQALRVERLIDDLAGVDREQILAALSAGREYDPERVEQSFERLMWQLERRHIELEKQRVAEELRRAERSGDELLVRQLAERDRALTHARAQLERQPRS